MERWIRLARGAYRAYGKGSGHPAQLNFGDCFASALAGKTGEPLLFKVTTSLAPTCGRPWGREDNP